MIAQGVRFNAEKKQVGNYYSTKVWYNPFRQGKFCLCIFNSVCTSHFSVVDFGGFTAGFLYVCHFHVRLWFY